MEIMVFGLGYGYYEIRCKMPALQGVTTLFPAFWLWQHPNEIDIFDGLISERGWKSAIIHHDPLTKCSVDASISQGNDYPMDETWLSKNFHTYGVAHTQDKISFFFDGKEVWTGDNFLTSECLNLILSFQTRPWGNLDLKGEWIVDYVRFHKFKSEDKIKTEGHWKKTTLFEYHSCKNLYKSNTEEPTRYMDSGYDETNKNFCCIDIVGTVKDGEIMAYLINNEIIIREGDVETILGFSNGTAVLRLVNGEPRVYYIDPNGYVANWYKNGSGWAHGFLTTSWTGAERAFSGSNLQVASQNVFYINQNGFIANYSWNGGWQHSFLTSTFSSHEQINISCPKIKLEEGNSRIYYLSKDGFMGNYFWNGNWNYELISNSLSNNILPNCYFDVGSLENTVVYVNMNNKLCSFSLNSTGNWIQEVLNSEVNVFPQNNFYVGNKNHVFYTTTNGYINNFYLDNATGKYKHALVNEERYIVPVYAITPCRFHLSESNVIYLSDTQRTINQFKWEECENNINCP